MERVASRRRHVLRLLVVVAALVLLVVPGRLLAAEHAHDTQLQPYVEGRAAETFRARPYQVWHVDAGVVTADQDRIELVEVRPRVASNTAAAAVSVQVCRPRAAPVTRTTGSLSEACLVLGEVSGAKTWLRPGDGQLVVSVVPTRAGRVVVTGYDVTYVDGGRRGTEHTGTDLTVRVAGP